MRDENLKRLSCSLADALRVAPRARSSEYALSFAITALRDRPADAIPELRKLLDVIREVPELQIFDHAYQWGVDIDLSVNFLFLVQWMISRAQQVGVDATISDVQRYVCAETIELTEILAVDGFETPAPIQIGGFNVLPWQIVEMSDTKWHMLHRQFFSAQHPCAAITRSIEVPRLHLRPWDQRPTYRAHSIEPMRDVLRCITATSGAGVALVSYWFEPPAWAPWAISSSNFRADSKGFGPDVKLDEAALSVLNPCVTKFASFDDAERDRYRLPMDRLNQSILAGMRTVDAAIDLGIAFESLYLPAKLDADIGKVLRDRASKFLGSTAKERKRIRNTVNDVYDLRSLAIHSGRFNTPEARPEWSDTTMVMGVLKQGQDILGRSLAKMILEGEPVWNEF